MIRYSFALTAAIAAVPGLAAEANLTIALPRMNVAEYHRPYVATWIEKSGDSAFAANVAIWYDVKKRDNGGAKWLKDVRQWWRKSGHELQGLPDGVSGATRPAGDQRIKLMDIKAVADLPPGNYEVVVEATRENGGREVLRLPLAWPPRQAANEEVKGEGELGGISLEVKP